MNHPVDGAMGAHPSFSIVIPTYNRPEHLAGCLRALARLDYPRDRFEVVVVDDGGTMPIEAVIAGFRDRLAVAMLKQPHAGPASARNLGAAHAKGRFLAFLDDDCRPTADWLRAFAASLALAPNRAIGGRTLNALPDNLYSTASEMLVSYLYAYYNADPDQARFFASNNLAVPVDRFRAVGGFDVAFRSPAAEDREFCDRWLHCGYQMAFAPEALVMHERALTFRSFVRQHFTYGCGAFVFFELQKRRSPGPGKAKPIMFYVNLLGFPFLQASTWRAPVLSALLAVAQIVNASGLLWQRFSRGSRPVDPPDPRSTKGL